MGLSLKGLTSSVSGKLLTGALALGAGNIVANSAEAAEITTITQNAAKLCIGSDAAGTIFGEKLGWNTTLTDGKVTDFATTDSLAFDGGQMDNPLNEGDYLAGVHRNFAYTKWPSKNGNIEGYYLYNITDVNNIKKSFVINSSNYPDYEDYMTISFVKGATPDQDKMIFLGDTISVYKSPFDAAGNVKKECKTGPVAPDFTFKINFPVDSIRTIGEFIFCLNYDGGGKSTITKLIVGPTDITKDKITTLKGITYSWNPGSSGFITTKDASGKTTTLLVVQGDTIILVNTDNPNDYNVTDASDIAVEDPAGRYAFKAINDGKGNYDIYICDSWEQPQVNKKIISNNILSLSNNLYYSTELNGWILYGKADDSGTKDKAYLIELIDPATMNVKVTEASFTTFEKNYKWAGEACVTIPGQVATIVKKGTPSDAGDASVVEKDQDAGSTPDAATEVVSTPDAGGEVDAGSTDADAAVDAWVDGKGDMQDIFADDATPDATEKPDVPKTNDTTPDAPDSAPDQSVQEVDGFTSKDAPEVQDDVTIVIPDMGTTKNDTITGPETEKSDAATGGPETTKPGVDAGPSTDTTPIITTTPSPKDPGCNAGSNGNASPFAIAAGVALAIGLARRKEEETVKIEQ